MEEKIFEKYPLMTHWNDKRLWSGFIKIRTILMRVSVAVPEYPHLTAATISGDEDCKRLMNDSGCWREIERLISNNATLLDLFELLETSVDRAVKTGRATEVWNPNAYLSVFNELQQIGLEKISYVSESMNEIHLRQEDPSFRSHVIKFLIPPGYPVEEMKVVADIPVDSQLISWSPRISASWVQFSKLLEKYDAFWTDMDEIDSSIQVLDPFNPTRGDTHRRIVISKKVILHVDVNPSTPRCLPNVRFLGADDMADEFDKDFTKYCKKWNANYSVLDNLRTLVNVTFPIKGDNMLTEDDVKCVICYTYNLEGDYPETVCDCGSFFHDKCLRELHLNEMDVNKSNAVDCPVCTLEIKFRN